MKKIAIFASGNGSNAEAIAHAFGDDPNIKVALVVCNRRNAGVYGRMERLGIPVTYFGREEWLPVQKGGNDGANVLAMLKAQGIALVALAGFMTIISDALLDGFEAAGGVFINIHPSLLPAYGGPGMWGHHVHEAVIANGETRSGVTVHRVTHEVDEGEIIAQGECEVLPNDTPDTLAERIHAIEHKLYPDVIKNLL